MLKISQDEWYVRLFHFCEMVWRKFTNNWYETNSRTTNLCTLIRTIFVWAPLAVAVNLAAWSWMFYVFIYYPFATFGLVRVGTALGFVVSVSLFAVTFAWLFTKFLKIRENYLETHRRSYVPEPLPEPKKPGFIDLVWKYLVDAHNNVCVMINIEPKQETVS